jgi:hypothetical protein
VTGQARHPAAWRRAARFRCRLLAAVGIARRCLAAVGIARRRLAGGDDDVRRRTHVLQVLLQQLVGHGQLEPFLDLVKGGRGALA